MVVGSGFGGSVAALRLAEKGYRVAVLEAGRRWHDDEFNRSGWNLTICDGSILPANPGVNPSLTITALAEQMMANVPAKAAAGNPQPTACTRLSEMPMPVVDDIRKCGNRADFEKAGFTTLPGGSYRDMWWLSHNEHGAYAARGVHGQVTCIDSKAEMVVARFDSHPMAANANFAPTSLPAFHAPARHLMR